MKKKNKKKEDEIYNDCWLYVLLLTTLVILLESIKKYNFVPSPRCNYGSICRVGDVLHIGVFRRFVVVFRIQQIHLQVTYKAAKMFYGYVSMGVVYLHPLHTAWTSCCMFLTCGLCQSLENRTATMGSRFFFMQIRKKMNNIRLLFTLM